MRVLTTDPISGQDILDITDAPYVIEEQGDDALIIYFENESNRQAYLEAETKRPGEGLLRAWNRTTDKAMGM